MDKWGSRAMSAGHRRIAQEQIILAIAAAVFVLFSVLVPDFLSGSNVISMVRNVSVLGILGIGMAITILGRGIDLSAAPSRRTGL